MHLSNWLPWTFVFVSITRPICASGNGRNGKVSDSTEWLFILIWKTLKLYANIQTHILFFIIQSKKYLIMTWTQTRASGRVHSKTSSVKCLNLNFDINEKCWALTINVKSSNVILKLNKRRLICRCRHEYRNRVNWETIYPIGSSLLLAVTKCVGTHTWSHSM